MSTRHHLLGPGALGAVLISSLIACGGSSGAVHDAPGPGPADAAETDAADTPGGDASPADAAVDHGWGTCGSEVVGPGELTRAGPLAIGLDGTVFLSTFGGGTSYIARRVPGAARIDDTWYDLGGVFDVNDLAVSPDGRAYFLSVPSRTGADSRLRVLESVAAPRAVELGAPIHTAASLAFDATGRLFVGSLDGIVQVDLVTGAHTPVAAGIQAAELLSPDPTHLDVVTYTAGVVELTLDATGAELSRQTIYSAATRALQKIGIDQQGRYYAIVREAGQEKILQFAHDFTGEVTLLMKAASQSSDFIDLAFGKGALACNLYVSGFASDRHAEGTTPGRP